MTLALPVLVTVAESDWLVPTVVFPKLRLVGLEPRVPTGMAVPVPESEIVNDGLDAFEVIVTLPVALLVFVGANFTVSAVLCPALRVSGVVIPLNVNPVPLMAA